jgi:hypothetical protein
MACWVFGRLVLRFWVLTRFRSLWVLARNIRVGRWWRHRRFFGREEVRQRRNGDKRDKSGIKRDEKLIGGERLGTVGDRELMLALRKGNRLRSSR